MRRPSDGKSNNAVVGVSFHGVMVEVGPGRAW
jgi:hypothetical protein